MYKRLSSFRRYLRGKDNGGATVEFVIIFPVLIFFILFIFLLAVDFFWMLTSQKAVERGAREAITRLPVAGALVQQGRILNYPTELGASPGVPCQPGNQCTAITTYSCRGGAYINADPTANCDNDRFNDIYDVVLNLAPNTILPEDLTITYQDSGLGRASEAYIPLVTVELQQSRILSSFQWIDRFFSVGTPTQPTVAAALVGESLGQ